MTTTRKSAAELERLIAGEILQAVAETTEGKFYRQLLPVIEFIKGLPVCSGSILEMHPDRFDYAFRFNTDFDGPVLDGPCRDAFLPGFLREGYSALLTGSKTGFKYGIQNVWLEYDSPFVKLPALFFDIGRDEPFSPEKAWCSLAAITNSFHLSLPQGMRIFLHKIADLNLFVVYYGCMLSRNHESIRLTLNGLEAENLLQILDQLGWEGNPEQVQRLADRYLKDAVKLVLAVDFGETLGSRIGIEVFYEQPAELPGVLYAHEMIDEEQYRFLLHWVNKLPLPPELSARLSQLYKRNVDQVYKRINHVKFVLDKDLVLTKVYLYYCF